jgi:hypothetical protein
MSPTPDPDTSGRITRGDLEAKLREIRGTAEEATPEVPETAQRTGMIVAAGAAMVVVFLLGRRRGRKKNTIVEIHRI